MGRICRIKKIYATRKNGRASLWLEKGKDGGLTIKDVYTGCDVRNEEEADQIAADILAQWNEIDEDTEGFTVVIQDNGVERWHEDGRKLRITLGDYLFNESCK